jgi:glycine betaine transporter
VLIIAFVTAVFTLSAVTGVSKGIKFLSQASAGLAIALFVFMLIVGPAVFLANLYIESLGTYATDFFRMSLQGTAFGDLEWMQWWTYFMMAWWVSWGAFVGVFLARISRGRTIRGFIMGVLVVPTVVFFTWFTVFGGTAIHVDMFQDGTIAKQTTADINSAFFATLDVFPFASVTSVIAIVLVVMFFVSGADANTYVLSMLTSGGSLTPRRSVLILWGVLTGVTAVVLMLAGGLNAIQNTVIVTSLPFLVIIAGVAVAFWKELASDRRQATEALTAQHSAVTSPTDTTPADAAR